MNEVIAVSIATLVIGFIIGRFIYADTFDIPTMNKGIRFTAQDHVNMRHEDNSLMQRLEDESHFNHYVSHRRRSDFKRLEDAEWKTMMFIIANKDCIDSINDEDKIKHKEEYELYLKKRVPLGLHKTYPYEFKLEDFIIMKKNPLQCLGFNVYFESPRMYKIHNEATAKYKDDSNRELLKKEFEEIYYKL